ncbi:MAG: sugar transferase [Anaerolineae bacterium]
MGILFIVIFSFLEPSLVISRAWLVLVWLLSSLLVISARFGWRRVVYRLRRRGYFVTPALIIGVNDEALALGEQLAHWKTSGLLLRGFVNNEAAHAEQTPAPSIASNLPVVGNIQYLDRLVEEHAIQELVVATSALSADQLLEIFRRYGSSNKINLRLSSGLFASFTTGLYVKELGFVPLISVNKVRLTPQEALLKRCVDIVGAAVGLVLLTPLFAVIAVAIRRDSPGAVIYRRRVLGQGGKVFDAFKFRSMYIDGDDRLTPGEWAELQTSHKLRDDPRGHAGGALPSQIQPGRAAAVGQRPTGTDEFDRAAHDHPSRAGEVWPLGQEPAHCQTWHQRSVAGQRPLRRQLRRAGRYGHAVHPQLFRLAGHPALFPDHLRGAQGQRRLLTIRQIEPSRRPAATQTTPRHAAGRLRARLSPPLPLPSLLPHSPNRSLLC